MDPASARWVTVSDSEFAHERAGLDHVRALLPDRAPYRAWSNFEFRDSSGKWHEVDLLVLGERRLHLVELKHYQGVIGGNAYRWERNGRSSDSPLLLARRKAQRLKDVIVRALEEMQRGWGRQFAPFVQEAIFLHAPGGRCALPPADRTDLFGLDEFRHSGLPGIGERLLEPAEPGRPPAGLIKDDQVAVALFEKIGFAVRREREVGTWRLTGPSESEGDGWQDWPAEHRVARSEQVTVRFFISPNGTSNADLAAKRRLVEREYKLTHRLRHDGVIAPRDVVDDELAAGLVFDRDPDARRLDLWLADRARALTLPDRLALIRQLAEALDYAHRNHVVHRGLGPEAVWITGEPPVARIGNWQLAGLDAEATTSSSFATRLFRDMVPSSDALERQAGAYLPPESRWQPGVDRIRVDVFSLGALAYFILTGRPPAEQAVELRERLQNDNGLDLAADLPEVGAGLRTLILTATRPRVGDRYPSTVEFRRDLDGIEQTAVVPTADPDADPLDAVPGTRLNDRFTLVRRLGSGSTAVGLLVEDAAAPGQSRVLKVARDDSAVARLEAEAAALRGLPADPLLVRLVEPETVRVGTRQALLLESAGDRTLAEELRVRPRLSLDLLQRWGTDLLRALQVLDRAGVDHRDIKPSNLGVRERRGDRSRHLVLFDFSLTRAGSAELDAGTPPYLDPFLGQGGRTRWDSAAERYAATVTLFEMATGRTPQYAADGTAATMTDSEVLIDDGQFDATVAAALSAFFRRALRRSAAERFDTAQDMAAAWTAVFGEHLTRLPDNAEALAAAATADTLLAEAGLSARAQSALEPLAVNTVGDLVAVDAARLTKLRGSSVATRKEVTDRAKQWRAWLAVPAATAPSALGADLEQAARLLVERAAVSHAPARQRLIRTILGLPDDDVRPVGAFASLAELGQALDSQGAPQVYNQIGAAVAEMTGHDDSRAVLDETLAQVVALVRAAGGLLRADAVGPALVTGAGEADARRRIVAGLARLSLERADQAERNRGDASPVSRRRRRRDGTVLLATDPALLDIAEPLGRRADELVASATDSAGSVVAVGRAAERLRELWPAGLTPPDDVALVRLAASLSTRAAASQRGELHSVTLTTHDAARVALAGLGTADGLHRSDIAARIRSRFPALAAVPEDRSLDEVLARAGIELDWDPTTRTYRSRRVATSTTGLDSATWAPNGTLADRTGDHREDRLLAESREACSFLALGVHPIDLDAAAEALSARFDTSAIDVTGVLIAGLREQGERAGLRWDVIEDADAAEPGSRPAAGLARLVSAALPGVLAQIDQAIDGGAPAARPVLLTDAAPLARYGHLGTLARYTDITARRRQAVWLLFPLDDTRSAAVDGTPVPLAHGGQFLILDRTWVDTARPTEASV